MAEKSKTVFDEAGSLAAATNRDGTWQDLTKKKGTFLVVNILNGATGPNQRPIVLVYYNHTASDTGKRLGQRSTTPTGSNDDTDVIIEIPPHVQYARTRIENPGNQAITPTATGHTLDSL